MTRRSFAAQPLPYQHAIAAWDCSDLRVTVDFDIGQRSFASWNLRDRSIGVAHLTYFIVSGPFVKIGSSSSPYGRLAVFAVGCPYLMDVRAVVVGGREIETRLHDRFDALAHRGDWFHLRDDLAVLIDRLAVEYASLLAATDAERERRSQEEINDIFGRSSDVDVPPDASAAAPPPGGAPT